MNLKLVQVAEDVGGRLEPGAEQVRATGCSIDSRTIGPGQLFFAIRGPRFDGHDFLEAARARGAVAAVVDRDSIAAEVGLPSIRVKSTTRALGRLARAVRLRWGRAVIGVTGSVGKTTTKEMIATVLGTRYNVLRSRGNFNNELGLPLSLLEVADEHDLIVLEMGMSAPGEITRLAEIAQPNEGVVTNVNPVHLEFFQSVDDIAAAKEELIKGLVEKPAGVKRAYLNDDDARVRAMGQGFDGDVVTWGTGPEAMFRVARIEDHGLAGTAFSILHEGQSVDFTSPLPGTHNVSNAAAAIGVAVTHGLEWGELTRAVRSFSTTGLRGVVRRYKHGFVVVDDSYNSNPAALREMIRMVAGIPGFRRRILVAGEMLELGKASPSLHAECGRAASEAAFDLIIAVQGDASAVLEGARAAGTNPEQLHYAETAEAAGALLSRIVQEGDVILLKGSRGVGLERVAEILGGSFAGVEA